MKKFKNLFLLILTSAFCASCGVNTSSSLTSSESTETSTDASTTESTNTEPHLYAPLFQAIENTKDDYMFVSHYVDDSPGYFFHEIYKKDEVYTRNIDMYGYIVLPEDEGYVHIFQAISSTDVATIDVRGRNMPISYFDSTIGGSKLIDYISYFSDDFSKVSDNTYGTSVSDFTLFLSNFVGSKNIKYCNYFELVIGEDDRLSELHGYEVYGEEVTLTVNLYFYDFDYSQWIAYQTWNSAGRKIHLTVSDLKSGTYENENVEIEGVITTVSSGSFTIAQKDDFTGPVGINVTHSYTSSFKVGDLVKVTGKVNTSTSNFRTTIKASDIRKISSDNYLPTFNEEYIVDNYGPGAYEYYYFMTQPAFTDSLYVGFGYINSLPEFNANTDLKVEIICPSFPDDSGKPIKSNLIIPKTASNFQDIYNELASCGVYSAESNTAKLICMENVLVSLEIKVVNGDYQIIVNYRYMNSSAVYARKSPEVRFKEVLGDDGFYIPVSNNIAGYPFGADSGITLESIYKKSGNKEGYYMYLDAVAIADFEIFLSYLDANYTLKQGVKDINSASHMVYQAPNGKYLDVAYSEYFTFEAADAGKYTVQMWCYDGDIILPKLIKEKVAEKVTPNFDIDSFQMLPGTYDSNYEVYTLYQYAGQKFENGLTVVTIDISGSANRRDELCRMYLDNNYTTVRLENGNPYSYMTRGSSHMVYKSKSNEHIFVDIASYSTNQYTFTGSDKFTYRIEVLIYEADAPIETKYDSDLSNFNSLIDADTHSTEYSIHIDLPNDAKVEVVEGTINYTSYDDLFYGYLNHNAFIYSSNLQSIYDSIIDYLSNNGFSLNTTGAGNVMASKYDESYNGTYYTIIYETGSNNIRICNSIGTRF